MTDIRLAIAVDAAGAITGIRTFNEGLGETEKKSKDTDKAVKGLSDQMKSFKSALLDGIGIGAGFTVGAKAADLLLSSVTGVANGIKAFASEVVTSGQKTAVMAQNFEKLAASIGSTSKVMLGEARAGTQGLVSDFDLMQSANKAVMLNLPITSREFATLAKGASALGRAMGQDATKSLDDLMIGLARGSPKILDNLGLIISETEAHEKYAASMGKTVGQLTEAEKKTAVYNAAITEMRANLAVIGNAQLTLGDHVQRVSVLWDNFTAAIGQAIVTSPALVSAFDAIVTKLETMYGWLQDNSKALKELMEGGIKSAGQMVTAFSDLSGFSTFVSLVERLGRASGGVIPLLGTLSNMALSSATSGVSTGLAVLGGISQRNSFMGYEDRSSAAEYSRHADLFKWNRPDDARKDDFKDIFAMPSPQRLAQIAEIDRKAAEAAKQIAATADAGLKASLATWAEMNKRQAWMEQQRQKMFEESFLMREATNLANAQGYLAIRNAQIGIGSDFAPKIATKIDPSGWYNHAGTFGYETAKSLPTATEKAAQALQAFANIAATSGSKLGKGLASILGQGAGLAGGISALGSATGVIGKIGPWGAIAASSIGIVSGIVGLFKKKPKEPPPEPPKQATAEAWRSFVTDQQGKGAAGVLAGVSGIKVTTPEDMAAQASIASQSFWQTFKTQGLIKAGEAFKAVRDKMVETFKAAGADDSAIAALIGPMSGLVDLADTKAFQGAADGATGFANALAAIANEQLPMSIDQFKAFEQQAVQGFEQMKQAAIDQGMNMEDAIKSAAQGSGVFLTTIKDAAAKYGFELGDSQKLFDAASGAGVAFAGSSQERLILSLDRLTETLGGAPPKFEQAMTRGADKFGLSPRVGLGADDAGVRGGIDAEQVGTVIAGKLNAALDKLSAVIAGQDINLSVDVPIDGGDLLASFTERIARGGAAGNRFREVLAE